MSQIISHTPSWVWMLLAGLIAIGISQTRTRQLSLNRITILPMAMLVLSLYSTNAAFGNSVSIILSWALACLACIAIVSRQKVPTGTSFDAGQKRITVPGSWVPLFLILGIFLGRYTAAAGLAIRPELAQDLIFSVGLSVWFGSLSGIFVGRALRFRRVTKINEVNVENLAITI